jgi:hypothetical protein
MKLPFGKYVIDNSTNEVTPSGSEKSRNGRTKPVASSSKQGNLRPVHPGRLNVFLKRSAGDAGKYSV